MSTAVEFYRGAEDGMEGYIVPGLREFAARYEAEYASGPRADYDPDVHRLVDDIIAGAPLPRVRSLDEARVVDRLVSDFCGRSDCTGKNPTLEALEGFPVSGNDFADGRPWIERLGEPVRRAWGYALAGRGIWRANDDVPFVSPDGVAHVGYLTLSECRLLAPTLSSSSPPPRELRCAFQYFTESIQLAVRNGHGLIVTLF